MGPIYSLRDFLDMLRRRARVILVLTLLGCMGSVWFALQQEHSYQSAVVIQVAQPTIADDLAKSTVDGSSARRIQLIEQRLMSRNQLLEIVDKFGIYDDLPQLRPSEIVDLMRQSIGITGVAAAREGFADDGTISVLTITATMSTPEMAQQVADEFASRIIDLSIQSRISQARETLQFFVEKENALKEELVRLEDEVATYRFEHDVSLPGVVELRRGEVAQINQSLLEIAQDKIALRREADQVQENERPATARRKLAELQEQMATLDEQNDLLNTRKEELEAGLQTTPQVERQLGAFERQIEQLQSQLGTIIERRSEAEVGFRLEQSSQSERLTVIEAASYPDYPVDGGRKKLAIMGAMGSIVMGICAAFGLELLRPVMRTAAQMERETGLMPVVSIPELKTDARSIKRRQKQKAKQRGVRRTV
ncbi:DUF874 domain-containing protein [Epibacterium sp. SM1979]|uniref:DUF874 domain-containing protein n=1 Tax=Tritonibacter litoralis TaxID=2662264 RepID=A0A843YDY0_9RHOB|nr:DUF874 domain-containing protein [Tritonibacter litoralis]MQQ09266.1 DUF874 domain-containing protein [Tritonibacter litoralis]